MTSGRHMPAAEAHADGLVDEIVDGEWDSLRAAAVVFAERAVAESLPLVKVRDRNDQVTGVDPQVFADFARRSPARPGASWLPNTTSAALRLQPRCRSTRASRSRRSSSWS